MLTDIGIIFLGFHIGNDLYGKTICCDRPQITFPLKLAVYFCGFTAFQTVRFFGTGIRIHDHFAAESIDDQFIRNRKRIQQFPGNSHDRRQIQ